MNAREFLNNNGSIPWDRSLLVSVVYEAYRLKLESGESIDDEAYVRDFPELGESLRHLIAAGHLVREGMTQDSVDDELWPVAGEIFADFLLKQELGKGAFARAYLALEGSMSDRPVVVKIAREVGDEAATLAQLRHTNIVPVHSIKRHELSGFTALCMPFYGCATLHDVIQKLHGEGEHPREARSLLDAVQQLNADQPAAAVAKDPEPILNAGRYEDAVLWIGAELCDALAYAHGQGVFHGDMKPANVLVDSNGHPLVFDFNLARTEEDSGGVGGTLAYMAPENLVLLSDSAWDEELPVSASSVDVYSLGATLYEAMSGQRPFDLNGPVEDANPADALLRMQRQGAPSLTERCPEIDPRVAAAIEACLAFKPGDRPGSAEELGRTFRRLLTWPQRVRRWMRRHPVFVATSTAGTTAVLLGVSIWLATLPPVHERDYLAAQDAFESGNYAETIQLAGAAVEANPRYGAAFELRGHARLMIAEQWHDAGEPDKAHVEYGLAFDSLTSADQLLPSDGRRDELRGYCAQRQGEDETAATLYKKAVAGGVDTAELRNNLGLIYLQGRRDLPDARMHLDESIHLNTELPTPRYNRALLEMVESHLPRRPVTEESIRDIEIAGKSEEHSIELHRHAARMHARAAEPDADAIVRHLKAAARCGFDLEGYDPAELVGYAINQTAFRELLASDSRFQTLSETPVGTPVYEKVDKIARPTTIGVTTPDGGRP